MVCSRWFILLILPIISYSQTFASNSLVYVSPSQGAKHASIQSQLIFRFAQKVPTELLKSELFHVEGEISGRHDGSFYQSSDGRTIVYKPFSHFSPAETVYVTIDPKNILSLSEGRLRKQYSFYTSSDLVEPEPWHIHSELEEELTYQPSILSGEEHSEQSGYGELDDIVLPPDFIPLEVTTDNDPTPGHIFMVVEDRWGTPRRRPYMIITDEHGTPVWFERVPPSTLIRDFKKLHNGNLAYYNRHKYFELDASYSIVDSFTTVNGYYTDAHEFLLTEDNKYFLFAFDTEQIDMSEYVEGGIMASVTGLIIQGFDENHELVFEWSSWDHIDITEVTEDFDLTSNRIDYVHGNSIELDYDGNLLVSCRHLDQVLKIDRETGEVLWRLGGTHARRNDFTFVNDERTFSHQHDFRYYHQTGTYTMFDNGNLHDPIYSSAVEYSLDQENMTIEENFRYVHEDTTHYFFFANARKLENGNMAIGWGGTRTHGLAQFTEVDMEGNKTFELKYADDYPFVCYRAPKYTDFTPGQAVAPHLTAVVSEPTQEDSITYETVILTMNVFGEHTFDAYSIYMSTEGDDNYEFFTETADQEYIITDLPEAGLYYFQVEAHSDDYTTEMSNEVYVIVDEVKVDDSSKPLPTEFTLSQNYPNPFNPSTIIPFTLPTKGSVEISLYNLSGQQVYRIDKEFQDGYQEHILDLNFASGLYVVRVKFGHRVQSRKIMLLK
ncbi:aryl-sulfate sulfotransferase [bacterium]|nr:aryl-sulfate sulfotransferase [bacterium]